MFPDARNSLRRWSVYAETKIPIPLAITLHNFVAPATEPRERIGSVDSPKEFRERTSSSTSFPFVDSPAASPSKEEEAFRKDRGMWLLHRQPQHTNSLLPQLKLEITTTFGDSEETLPTVVYSQHSPQTHSLHPSWEHLDERISIENLKDWWNQNELYKSMKIKLSVVANRNGEETEINQEDDCFLETFLHPSFLERIDLKGNQSNDDSQFDDEMDHNSLLPPGLPPNAMMIHFSDGSIRCPHNIYQTLKENYDLEPPPIEDFSRFEDDVFDTLDHVQQTPQRPRNRSITSLLDQDHEESNADAAPVSNAAPQSPDHSHPSTPSRSATGTNNNTARIQKYPQHKSAPFANDEQDIMREERRQEKLELLRLIAEEERALEEDLENLKAEQLTLTQLVEEVQSVEQDISKVKAELHKQSLKLEKEEILKESQSIKLLRDLRDIYPIAPDASQRLTSVGIIQSTREPTGGPDREGETKGYLIRGLRLPMDIYTTTIPEEEVNTSLGYCAHLVFMVAKYLAIPLRHRIFCNGSRSAIELDGIGIFPLFLGRLAARALEREQVDRGARLLGTNVECILTHLDLQPNLSTAPSHILERLENILDFVADGKSTTK